MENAWNEYSQLERDVDWLKSALQGQMSRCDLSQVCGSVISINSRKQSLALNGNELNTADVIYSDKAKNWFRGLCVGF